MYEDVCASIYIV